MRFLRTLAIFINDAPSGRQAIKLTASKWESFRPERNSSVICKTELVQENESHWRLGRMGRRTEVAEARMSFVGFVPVDFRRSRSINRKAISAIESQRSTSHSGTLDREDRVIGFF